MFIKFIGISQVMRLRKLNRHWFVRLSILFDRMSYDIQEKFLQACGDYFDLTHSSIVFSPTAFGKQKGLRIDRIMELQLKENSPEVRRSVYKTIKLECLY